MLDMRPCPPRPQPAAGEPEIMPRPEAMLRFVGARDAYRSAVTAKFHAGSLAGWTGIRIDERIANTRERLAVALRDLNAVGGECK